MKSIPRPRMQPIETRVLEYISSHRLGTADQSLVVAVSGGPDSVCLLHLLTTLFKGRQLICVYVDHRLRPEESVLEAELVNGLCQKLGTQFITETADVPVEVELTGESIEACARRLRYQVLEKIRTSKGADLIAVGHTADDQVEEVLLRLIRGSGLKGLSGMRPRHGCIVRPLLEVSRAEIITYLQDRDIKYCHDSSNDDPRFLRNRIRLELLPLLEDNFNPSIRKTILKTARILEIEDDFLSQESDLCYSSIAESEEFQHPSDLSHQVTMATDRLSACHQALRHRIIERACWEAGFRPESDSIARIAELLKSPGGGGELHLPDGGRVVKQYESLLFSKLDPSRGPRERFSEELSIEIEIPCPGSYPVYEISSALTIDQVENRVEPEPGLLVLDAERVTFPLSLRSVAPGDRFTPLNGPGSKKVARFLNDRRIPAIRRPHYPVLVSGDNILAVVGLEIDHHYRVNEQTRQFLLVRLGGP